MTLSLHDNKMQTPRSGCDACSGPGEIYRGAAVLRLRLQGEAHDHAVRRWVRGAADAERALHGGQRQQQLALAHVHLERPQLRLQPARRRRISVVIERMETRAMDLCMHIASPTSRPAHLVSACCLSFSSSFVASPSGSLVAASCLPSGSGSAFLQRRQAEG